MIIAYLTALWLVALVFHAFPIFIVARKLRVSGSWWAMLPVGDLITLARCGDRTGWGAVWPSLVFWTVGFLWLQFVVLWNLWGAVCWHNDVSKWWGRLASVPFVGVIGAWAIALKLVPPEEGYPEEQDAPEEEAADNRLSLELPPAPLSAPPPSTVKAVLTCAREPALAPTNPTPDARQGRIPAARRPPAWLASAGLVFAALVAFLFLDKTQLHWYAPADVTLPLRTAVAPTEVPPAAPDRVVGIVETCDVRNPGTLDYTRMYGCTGTLLPMNRRLELTIRSSVGGSYVVSVPIGFNVRLGDEWPP